MRHALRAWRGRDLVGILPLVYVKSRLFGDLLISTAFTTGGSIVADDAEFSQRFAIEFVALRQSAPLALGTAWHVKADLYSNSSARSLSTTPTISKRSSARSAQTSAKRFTTGDW